MTDIVTLTHRNVCKDGFTVVGMVDSGMWRGAEYVITKTMFNRN